MIDAPEGIAPRDPNGALRDRLRRILPADTSSAEELEIAVKDLQDLARTRLA